MGYSAGEGGTNPRFSFFGDQQDDQQRKTDAQEQQLRGGGGGVTQPGADNSPLLAGLRRQEPAQRPTQQHQRPQGMRPAYRGGNTGVAGGRQYGGEAYAGGGAPYMGDRTTPYGGGNKSPYALDDPRGANYRGR